MGNGFRIRYGALLCALVLALAGCATRSISDSGYKGEGQSVGGNPSYRGELSAYDILGVDLDHEISEDEIRKALSAKQPFSMQKGSALCSSRHQPNFACGGVFFWP